MNLVDSEQKRMIQKTVPDKFISYLHYKNNMNVISDINWINILKLNVSKNDLPSCISIVYTSLTLLWNNNRSNDLPSFIRYYINDSIECEYYNYCIKYRYNGYSSIVITKPNIRYFNNIKFIRGLCLSKLKSAINS